MKCSTRIGTYLYPNIKSSTQEMYSEFINCKLYNYLLYNHRLFENSFTSSYTIRI